MKIEDSSHLQTKQLAMVIGLSDRQVRNLFNGGILTQTGRGKYDLEEAVQAWGRYLLDGKAPSDLASEKLRLTAAQARLAELNGEEKAGTLIDAEHVRQIFLEIMVLIGTQLDGLAGRVSAELAVIDDPAIVRRQLFNETRRIRDAAADRLKAFIGDQ